MAVTMIAFPPLNRGAYPAGADGEDPWLGRGRDARRAPSATSRVAGRGTVRLRRGRAGVMAWAAGRVVVAAMRGGGRHRERRTSRASTAAVPGWSLERVTGSGSGVDEASQ